MLMSELITFQIKDNIAIITLNRTEKRNALNRKMLILLYKAIDRIINDDQIKVGIITGNGPAFCSGIDLNTINTENLFNPIGRNIEIPELMAICHKPIIGAINGIAITGGLEIALNCDFLIASDKASFVDTHARVGIHPGWGVTQLLQQSIGQKRAKQMSFTCQPISAQTAYEWGLVNEIVPPEQLVRRSLEIADEICKNTSELFSTIKDLIENRNRMSQEASFVLERQSFRQFIKLNLKIQR